MLVKLTPASEVREPPKMPHACGAVTESGRPMGRMAVGAGCPDRTAQRAISEQRCVTRAVISRSIRRRVLRRLLQHEGTLVLTNMAHSRRLPPTPAPRSTAADWGKRRMYSEHQIGAIRG